MLKEELIKFRAIRVAEYEKTNKSHHHYFFRIGLGVPYEHKINAIDKMLLVLDGHEVKFTIDDMDALEDSRLCKIMKKHKEEWPRCLRDQLADRERALHSYAVMMAWHWRHN